MCKEFQIPHLSLPLSLSLSLSLSHPLSVFILYSLFLSP